MTKKYGRKIAILLIALLVLPLNLFLSSDTVFAEEGAEVRTDNVPYGSPTIDGEIDDVWDNATVLPIDRVQAGEDGATGEARVLWDEDNLYILVEVEDTELDDSAGDAHEQDSVEVFIDEQNTKEASYGEGVAQYRVNFNNEQSFNPGEASDGFESETAVDGTNYLIEMKIPLRTIDAAADHTIGFDIQVNDAIDGSRQNITIWNADYSGDGWQHASVFGELTLLGDTLPVTNTSTYNFLLIGALILVAGAGSLYINKRKNA